MSPLSFRRGPGLQPPYGVAEAMDRVISRARKATEATEREAVAEEVGWLVRSSGLSRAEFATAIGTSVSRLSTYVTGKVTPSATLLLRMRSLTDSHGQRKGAALWPPLSDFYKR